MKFGFLFDGHEYHPFYKWVVQNPGEPVLDWPVLGSTSQESERQEDPVPPDAIQEIMTTLISYTKVKLSPLIIRSMNRYRAEFRHPENLAIQVF